MSTVTDTPTGRTNPGTFLLQVVAEVRKVVWPTRRELVKSTAVVLTFVAASGAYIAAVDFGVTELVFTIFG